MKLRSNSGVENLFKQKEFNQKKKKYTKSGIVVLTIKIAYILEAFNR
jgi:hypothetical protein